MFEARLSQCIVLKKIIEAIRDLVQEGNLDCSETGISLQALDSSHVSLVALVMHMEMFEHFRCDRNISLGINLANVHKILKCAATDDAVTLRSEDAGDSLTLVFESSNQHRIFDFDLKLMTIDSEHLGIPDTTYKCTVTMASSEFKRIITELSSLGESCVIAVTKEGIRFSVNGDLGSGNVTCRQYTPPDGDSRSDLVSIEMEEPVELTFASRYLKLFAGAAALSETVVLSLSADIPICVEYPFPSSHGSLKFFLAPKIDDAV